jgi:hypothetical protein
MAEIVYKLTTADGRTRVGKLNEMQWGDGIEHAIPQHLRDVTKELCTRHWLHAYADPLLAEMLDAAHGNYGASGVLWECEAEVVRREPDKLGCWRVKTLRRVARPAVTIAQRVRFAILASLEVYDRPGYVAWAEGWLSGANRSTDAARAAAADVAYIAYAADGHAAFAAYVAEAYAAPAYAAEAAAYAAVAKGDIQLLSLARRAVAEEENDD